jgi:hypothetical protein
LPKPDDNTMEEDVDDVDLKNLDTHFNKAGKEDEDNYWARFDEIDGFPSWMCNS